MSKERMKASQARFCSDGCMGEVPCWCEQWGQHSLVVYLTLNIQSFRAIVTDLQPPEMYFIKRKISETLEHQVCCLAF